MPEGGTALAGLSLTGLAAVHAVLTGQGAFRRVLAQSGSFWWEDGRLIEEVASLPPPPAAPPRIHLSVGAHESAAWKRDLPTALKTLFCPR